MKIYPLDIQNIGEDVYTLMSKGHHDPHVFMKQVREDGYSWALGMPYHTYCRTLPPPDPSFVCWYAFTDKPGRGAFPITVAVEAYNEDVYEAIAPPIAASPIELRINRVLPAPLAIDEGRLDANDRTALAGDAEGQLEPPPKTSAGSGEKNHFERDVAIDERAAEHGGKDRP